MSGGAAAPQRAWRAPCPGCGAPVEFRCAQSTHAVCSFCRSTVVRDGDTLARIGQMAELFDDHSPLQLGAAGRWEGQGFTLVGRLQYRSASGPWTEWQAALDDGSGATLSEDNGAYVFVRPATLQRPAPPPAQLRLGNTTAIGGKAFSITFNEQVALVSAQGELPHLPPMNQPFAMVELRSADGEVLGIDYGSQPPEATRGRAVRLEELRLTGLKDDNAKEVRARQFACPHCGAPVEVRLEASQAVTCRSCDSIIDLRAGIGGELRHALQSEPVRPLIPLGSAGKLQGADWQVVGFQHRMGHDPQEPDERFGWSEYLLYNRKRGFIFLVDSQEGWSVVRPTTGAPVMAEGGQSATYLGTRYKLKWAYNAETDYVTGEFYWPVQRGSKTFNRDFAAGSNVLTLEQTPAEITWSSGSAIGYDTVAQAFGLKGEQQAALKRGDAGPTSAGKGSGCGCLIVILLVLLILLVLMLASARRDCDPRVENCAGSTVRSSGGSWGGYSSGGGHK